MTWYVNRQHYWPDGEFVVEMAYGGIEYSNPDMLADPDRTYRKLGCDQEYADPREALATAIKVRDEWKKHLDDGEDVRIEHGFTAGMTIPFCSYPSDKELKEWAEAEAEKLDKCEMCGDIITGKPFVLWDFQDWKFCSDYCAERFYGENCASDEDWDDEDLE
jgi:hypothetical protein